MSAIILYTERDIVHRKSFFTMNLHAISLFFSDKYSYNQDEGNLIKFIKCSGFQLNYENRT